MAYRIRGKDKSVEAAVRRIAAEQIDRAISAMDEKDAAEAIHDVRKRCKKLRALIRLIRPAFAGYAAENAAFRDTAQLISGARDAQVMQETYDALMKRFAPQVERRAMAPIRRRFTIERRQQAGAGNAATLLAEVRARLIAARRRAGTWQVAAQGWDALSAGLGKTVGKARTCADAAFATSSPPAFHELRKHLKYHWHHTRLLAGLWPEMMEVRAAALASLTERLGLHHDLWVFETRLKGNSALFGSPGDVALAASLAARMRKEIEEAARIDTLRLLAQSPGQIDRHWHALWDAWRMTRPTLAGDC